MRPTKYPSVNDIVMVNPVRITDTGVYVNLLEYNCEGLIILSDLSRSRFRSLNKVVSLGKKFPASVLTIDENTGNITLSKKGVSTREIKTCENNFKIAKNINDIVLVAIKKLEKEHNIIIDPSIFYQTFIWSISTDPEYIYASLRAASKDFDKIYEDKLHAQNIIWTKCFHEVLQTKFKEKEIVFEAVLEIISTQQSGVNIIRSALLKGQAMATDIYPFKIKIVKPPYYSITIKSMEQEKCIKLINAVITIITKDLEEQGAKVKIIKLPEVVIDKEFEPENSDTETSSSGDE